jgi:hypothetical protein
MSAIDQNSALLSLERALVPAPLLIDGRTEQDRLGFLAEFASLINFYDKENNIHGNWSPFLLKDPLFLLASISKTGYAKLHTMYLNTCLRLDKVLAQASQIIMDTNIIPVYFNQLFDQLISVFMHFKRWIYYMQRSDDEYTLKTYVIHQTQSNFSKYFWAIISLRQNLFLSAAIKGIEPVDTSRFQFFDHYDEIIWKQNKDKSPYWEVLNLQHPIKKNTSFDFFKALKKVGDSLFNFFHTVIKNAGTEFEKLKVKGSKYPDTILLRVFVNLLKAQQDQLNGISQKHLQFYYNDILKQTERLATPDSAFICAELAKTTSTFNLRAGTLFNAGTDAQKNPILFQSVNDVSLNPAAITGVITVSVLPVPGSDKLSDIYFHSIPNPGMLQKDENGKIQSWETFGPSKASPVMPVAKLGTAFSSPLLLLREGVRDIIITLTFAAEIDEDLLLSASYYLSTQTAWYKVVPVKWPNTEVIDPKIACFKISMEVTAPPVVPFTANPEKLDSTWPALKIEFDHFSVFPELLSLKVDINVSGVKSFQLYNDHGALSTKTPFQLFGPTPTVNSNFMMGSDEVFSKPLTWLLIQLDWNNLPDDFLTYYQAYNDYLDNIDNPPEPNKCFIVVFWIWLKGVFTGKKDEPEEPPFNDRSFKVDFSILQNASWSELDLVKMTCNGNNNEADCVPYQTDCPIVVEAEQNQNLLFGTYWYCPEHKDGKCKDCNCKDPHWKDNHNCKDCDCADCKCKLSPSSFFGTSTITGAFTPDPGLQGKPLKFTDSSASGFMRMQLSAPSYGFGVDMYPNVVSYIAFQNAARIYNKETDFLQPANMPFAPKVTGLVATYSASHTYTFSAQTGLLSGTPAPADNGYPIQCFLCAPFGHYYQVYDSRQSTPVKSYAIGTPSITSATTTGSVPFFPSLNYSGFMFLEMDNLIPSDSISLYFELARKYSASSAGKKIDYYYLNKTGWGKLAVLADGTNNLSCPGIIRLNIPEDVTNDNPVMPGNKYWFCLAVTDISAFAQTVFLKTNGIEVQRSGNAYLTDSVAPVLNSNAITKTQNPLPQIATIVQPFPSFGGRPAENELTMNQRTSNRLKTKDRAVSGQDYYRLIRQQYNDIYYSKSVFNTTTKGADIYVVKALR